MTKRSRATGIILPLFVMLTLLLGACDSSPEMGNAVVVPTAEEEEVVTAPAESIVELAEEREGEEEAVAGDVTVITSTNLITGTEVTTDAIITTDTVVLEEQQITTIITDTELITDVTESTDSSTSTESDIITDTTQLTPETSTGVVVAEVGVTAIAPTPTPTVVVELIGVVTDTIIVNDTAFAGIEGSIGNSTLASTLRGSDFESVNGEVAGEIEDLVINMQTGQVLYVLIEYGGFLDIGDTDMPVPLSAFSWGQDEDFILNIPGEYLEQFPGVSNDWPQPNDSAWDSDVRTFWETKGYNVGFDAAESANRLRRASNMLNNPIIDPAVGGGNIQDMIISLGEGRVTYMLITLGAIGTVGDLLAVPLSLFDSTVVNNEFTFNPDLDRSLLERAPRFNVPTFAQSRLYAEGYDNEWQNYWNDAGYSMDPTGIGD